MSGWNLSPDAENVLRRIAEHKEAPDREQGTGLGRDDLRKEFGIDVADCALAELMTNGLLIEDRRDDRALQWLTPAGRAEAERLGVAFPATK